MTRIKPPKTSEIFLCFIAAIPGILWPWEAGSCLHGEDFALGYPLAGFALDIGHETVAPWYLLRLYPFWMAMIGSMLLWTSVMLIGNRARRWAFARDSCAAGLLAAALLGTYCALLFVFARGIFQAVWTWQMYFLLPGLDPFEQRLRFGQSWLPIIFLLAAGLMIRLLVPGLRRNAKWHRATSVLAVLCLLTLLARCYLNESAHLDEILGRVQQAKSRTA